MTLPILPGLDGVQKMSKSYGNTIALTDPPDDMFGKVMSVPDALVREYFTLTTQVGEDEIARLLSGHPRDAKEALGRALVAKYHGDAAARAAAGRFRRVFTEKQVPEDMPEVTVPAPAPGEAGLGSLDLVMLAGFAKSKSEVRRLIVQGGVTLDGQRISDVAWNAPIRGGEVLRVGKLQFARLRKG
jgi:tyrosyl-tRNA synthetase